MTEPTRSATSSSSDTALSASASYADDEARKSASRRTAFRRILVSIRRWWRHSLVDQVDQAAIIKQRRDDCALSERYLFMTAMSAGIAVIGLLQSSTAVVIGAMLLSPLMGPIMGLGFALAIGDFAWLKQSARSLGWGSLLGIALCAALVFFSPIQTITPEIAARTQPNLFDLFVALFSGMAGAYAMIRGQAGAVVGVAIATALMPPLAVVGFGLATLNWTAFSGAMLLYLTNLVTIALTALAMARIYGFRSSLSARQTRFQSFVVLAVFAGLVVPLAFSLSQIAWEARAQGAIRNEIEVAFVEDSAIDNLAVDFRSSPISVNATVFTPVLRGDADVEADLARALKKRLGREFVTDVTQIKVTRDPSAAERAQLAAANEQVDQTAALEERARSLATRLALVAGVSEENVTVDTNRKRATVRATRLDGASMAAYRTLEARIARTEEEWSIELVPPRASLPSAIPFDEDGPNPVGARALTTIEWAAKRLDMRVVLTGDSEQAAQAAEILGKAGVDVTVQGGSGELRAQWGSIEE
ncbi:MAG: TIGR00341 family protein [Pseudomonadota bacterium]